MISVNQAAGDTIGLSAKLYHPALVHYYHGTAPVYVIENEALAYPFDPNKIDKSFVERLLHSFPPIKSHLWLVYPLQGDKKLQQMFRTVMREQYRVQEHWIFNGIDLFLVTPASSSAQVGSPKKSFIK